MKIKQVTYFGIGRKSTIVEVGNDAPFSSENNLTKALMERDQLKKKWWNPKNIKVKDLG